VILKVGNIAFDCDDVLKVASFWSAALGRPLDTWSSERSASIGFRDAERVQAAWLFNKVPEPKRAKNRNHLDLLIPDPSTIDELVALGATVVGEHEIPGANFAWTVMEDPEGNEFCVGTKSFTGWD